MPLYELYTGWQQARAQRQRWLAAAAASSASQQQQQQPAAVQAARGGRVLVALRAARAAGTAGAVQLPAVAQQQRQPQQPQQLRPIDLFYAKLKVGCSVRRVCLAAQMAISALPGMLQVPKTCLHGNPAPSCAACWAEIAQV